MVAIILVNYNGYDDTRECIESLKQLNNKNNKIIVVDNCSTDNSLAQLKELQKSNDFILIASECNNGFSAGNNKGINYAFEMGMDYFWLLNNDTIVEPDSLDKLLLGFNESSKCGCCISKILYENDRNTIWYAGGAINKYTARVEHFCYGKSDENYKESGINKITFATGCCMLLSRTTIEQIGLLSEDYFLYEEDTEYCCRMIESDIEILYIPEARIYHKVSASVGIASPMAQYYLVRNKYYLIKSKYKKLRKVCAYMYCTTQFIFRCIKNELKFKYFKMGYNAFLKKEIGKSKIRL